MPFNYQHPQYRAARAEAFISLRWRLPVLRTT